MSFLGIQTTSVAKKIKHLTNAYIFLFYNTF